jgi:hypothetical protein
MHLTRTKAGFLLAIGAGLILGATFGQPGNGRAAAPDTKPKPKTAPTISGAAEIGTTLVATRGTWDNKPTSYHYQWVRCNSTGAACVAISAATARIYTITGLDEAHTLRITVTAHNASGSASASSAATLVVPPSGCPSGTGAIAVAGLASRLQISPGSVTPAITRSTSTIHLRFTVTACGNRPVVGATVFATAIPYNQFGVAQSTTDSSGNVVLTETRHNGFPASRHQRLLAVFVRAWKQGEPETGGISTSRVVSFRFAHHH